MFLPLARNPTCLFGGNIPRESPPILYPHNCIGTCRILNITLRFCFCSYRDSRAVWLAHYLFVQYKGRGRLLPRPSLLEKKKNKARQTRPKLNIRAPNLPPHGDEKARFEGHILPYTLNAPLPERNRRKMGSTPAQTVLTITTLDFSQDPLL